MSEVPSQSLSTSITLLATGKARGMSGVNFAPCRTPPDNQVNISLQQCPERFLRILFQRWNPAGKNRPHRASEGELTEWIDGLIRGEQPPEVREAFHCQVRVLGWRLIGLLNRFGITAELLEDWDYEKRYGYNSAGMYSRKKRMIMIKDSALFSSSQSTLVHEFGHAIDHLISSLCTGGFQVSVKLWHWFGAQRTGFVTDYAQANPAEYLAESLEAYFLKSQYARLQSQDLAMYTFVDDMITISNG